MPVDEMWPDDDAALITLQEALGREADERRRTDLWQAGTEPRIGGCFVAFARGEGGPGRPGDRAWAAAVVWRPDPSGGPRDPDAALRGVPVSAGPRRAADVLDQAVVVDQVPAAYSPGLLARREGPILQRVITSLATAPDVVLVDATGVDHPRRAGLAVHLGAAVGLPTVGVTQRGLIVTDPVPELRTRGESEVVRIDGEPVGAWLCTRSGARPLLVHPGWRTDLEGAVAVVLAASTPAARTPVPLQDARRLAREARHIDGAG